MSESEKNVSDAFAGESQANRKYINFAEKARKEGFENIALLFKAVAEAETVHARNHLNVMKEIKSTKENLVAAKKGENYESIKMYPEFIETAKKENNNSAENSFSFALEVEKIHERLFDNAIEKIESNSDIEKNAYHVCQVCGNTVTEVPDKCPICNSPKESFKQIE